MKNLFYMFLILFVISCDKDSEETSVVEISNVITVLDATGTLAEQTTEEAKKIIFGRWDFSDSAKPGITKNVACEFDYIEFTDDNYIMGFLIEGQSNSAFGTYELNEDANGFVTSVALFFNNGDSEDDLIATLSDVVVTEENNELTSTFTIVLNLSDSDFEICNNLEGSHTTQKEEAMEESDSTDEDSNHVLFVNTWTLVSAVQNEEDISSEMYEQPCIEFDFATDDYVSIEDCTHAKEVLFSVSTYGTYTLAYNGSSEGTKVDTGTWSWSDDSQTAFYVMNDGTEGNDDDRTLITIVSLNDTDAELSEEDDRGTIYYTIRR